MSNEQISNRGDGAADEHCRRFTNASDKVVALCGVIFIYAAKKEVRRQLKQSLEFISLCRQQVFALMLYQETQVLFNCLRSLLEGPGAGRRSDRPDFVYPHVDLVELSPTQELDSFQGWSLAITQAMAAVWEYYAFFKPSHFMDSQDSLWTRTRHYIEGHHHNVDALLKEDFMVVIGCDFRYTHTPPRGGTVAGSPVLSDVTDPQSSPESTPSPYRAVEMNTTSTLPEETIDFDSQMAARLSTQLTFESLPAARADDSDGQFASRLASEDSSFACL
eukprot:scaffold2914_cov178-Amphora_coffeaeformis.AAC.5